MPEGRLAGAISVVGPAGNDSTQSARLFLWPGEPGRRTLESWDFITPMAEYLVLARKYRSAGFQEVVGQEHITTTLINAVKTGRIAQAYLFTGTRGVGKTTVARILAKALNCLSAESATPEPCSACDACVGIARGDDMDVLEIDGASNRGIEEIRQLRSNAVLHPARCRYKVYYIDEVHMLTKEAFNALLKTLEEPPPHVKFIFATTEAAKIPATIVSRCQRFDFRNISTGDIAGQLKKICKAEKIRISDDAVFRLAKAAAGSLRDGISLLDQLISSSGGKLDESDVLRVLGTPPDDRMAAIVAAIVAGETAEAIGQLDQVLQAGYPLEGVAVALGDQFRHIMLALTCGPDSELIEVNDSARQALATMADRMTVPAAVHAVGVCEQLMRGVRGSSFGRALAEAAVVRLAAADKFVDPASLVQRLERLAAGGTVRGAPTAGKKKPLSVPVGDSPADRGAQDIVVRWEADWLGRNWSTLMNRLGAMGHGSVAGLLKPARPLAVEPGEIRLGFSGECEPIRTRAAGPMAGQVAEALSALAGRSVQCRFVSTGEDNGRGMAADGRPVGGVGSAERKKVESDPAVKAVIDLFGGRLVDVCRDVEPARTAEQDDRQDDDGPAAGDDGGD